MARILLINPHNPSFVFSEERHIPLSLLYLSSYLKKDGHLRSFIDIGNDQITSYMERTNFDIEKYYADKIKHKILDFIPCIIGISVHFAGRFQPAITIAKLIKKEFPNIPIVLGGIHPTLFPKEILKEYNCIDFAIQGESEVSFRKLVNSIENNTYIFDNIDGLAFRRKGEIVINKKNKFIREVDSIPFPDYNLVNIKDYYFDTSQWINPKKLPVNLSVYILSSRSCPRQCTFCSMFVVHGPSYRMRSATNVVDEIEYLYNEFDQRYFSFVDDNFSLNKVRTVEICQEILKRGLNIQFDTPNGLEISSLDEGVLDGLVRAGMVKTCLAIESGSSDIRKAINKRLSQKKIIEVFKILNKYPQLAYNVFFIIGFPGETQQTLKETQSLIKQLKLKKAIVSFATPFPGTELYKECIDNDLLDIAKENLHNIDNFYFAHNIPFFKPYNLEIQELVDFRLKVYKELNMRKQLNVLCRR